MTQCLGRLVKDGPKGVHMLSFEEGGFFHVPLRCEIVTRSGDLCDTCSAKEKKTKEKICGMKGITIGGPLPSYLMGRVTDPIPYWSRLYDSAWFRLKIEEGYTLSEETMAKVKGAAKKAYEDVTTVPPEPLPSKVKATKKPASVVTEPPKPKATKKPVSAEKLLEELPVIQPEQKAPVKRKPAVKKASLQQVPIPMTQVVGAIDISDHEVIHISVRKQEVDGRLFYLDSKKDKLYDMKCKYVGRLKDGAVVDYPDSDADAS